MNLQTKINKVTVFSDRAQISRLCQVKLEEGIHNLVLPDLPNKIIENSVQVQAEEGILLKEVKTIQEAPINKKQNKETLQEELHKIKLQISEIEDTLTVIQNEKQFIENIATKLTNTNKDTKEVELSPEKWAKMVDFYRTKLESLHKEIRDYTQKREKLDKNYQDINLELYKLKDLSRIKKKKIEITLEIVQAKEYALEVSYLILDALWKPTYDLRVATETKTMSLAYNATIKQNTGEDWEDVNLSLSTAKVGISGFQPGLTPWRIDLSPVITRAKKIESALETQKEEIMSQRDEIMPIKLSSLEGLLPSQEEYEENDESDTVSDDSHMNAFSEVFQITGKKTIKNEEEAKKVTIVIENFDVFFRYSTVPKLSPFTYLKAKSKNTTPYPFLRGETQVFLNNNFVTNARILNTSPDEEFWTFLGIDDAIKVKHKLIRKYQKQEGVFSRKNKLIYEYQILVTNTKRTEEEIVVWDQLPISEHENLVVELIEPKISDKNPDIKMTDQNSIEWLIKLKPGKEAKLPFIFSVEYPKNMKVEGLL